MPYANLGFGVTSDGGNVTDLNNSSEKTSPRKRPTGARLLKRREMMRYGSNVQQAEEREDGE